jgi:Zn-dependent peptidase ImmA (M78 family)
MGSGSQTNPAIKWLAKLSSPLSPKDYLFSQAKTLLLKSGQVKPPFDPRKALPTSVLRIETVPLSRGGLLIPVDGGFVIKLNSRSHLVRQKFVCAHEIAHTFFYDNSGPRPWRPTQSLSPYWVEEDLCYQFAEEMLMPSHEITSIARTLSPSVNSFLKVRSTFDVSNEALARRIARLNLWHCIFILLASESNLAELKKKTKVRKPHDYNYFSFNWDTLFSLSSELRAATTDPPCVKTWVLNGSDLFRRGGQHDQWRVESISSTSPVTKTSLIIIMPEQDSGVLGDSIKP